MLYTYRSSSPIGELTISSNGTEITGQKYLSPPSPENYEEKDLPVMSPLLPEGTSFRKKVWELLHDSLSLCGGANGSLTGYAAGIDRK